MKKYRIKLELDTCGLLCPYPLAKTRKILQKMHEGEILRVISTDPASQIDFKVFGETSGHILLEQTQENNTFIFIIQKHTPR